MNTCYGKNQKNLIIHQCWKKDIVEKEGKRSRMKKYDDCRYGHCGYPYGDNFDKNNVECLYSGKRKIVTTDTCRDCDYYDCRNIEYPIDVNGFVYDSENHDDDRIGNYCRVFLEDCKKTYLGIYLGKIPTNPGYHYREKSKKLHIGLIYHIAILVPELKKIVYDTECAWGLISSPEQMTDVTEEELNAEICKRLKENELDFFAKYFGGK